MAVISPITRARVVASLFVGVPSLLRAQPVSSPDALQRLPIPTQVRVLSTETGPYSERATLLEVRGDSLVLGARGDRRASHPQFLQPRTISVASIYGFDALVPTTRTGNAFKSTYTGAIIGAATALLFLPIAAPALVVSHGDRDGSPPVGAYFATLTLTGASVGFLSGAVPSRRDEWKPIYYRARLPDNRE